MGVLRSVLTALEAQLTGLGYTRSKLNFTLEQVPRSIAHKVYTFGVMTGQPAYLPGDDADYGQQPPRLDLLILWKVRGEHNASGSYQEGYLDVLDAFEELETELVSRQSQSNAEEISIAEYEISPLFAEPQQEFILLRITLNIDVIRRM